MAPRKFAIAATVAAMKTPNPSSCLPYLPRLRFILPAVNSAAAAVPQVQITPALPDGNPAAAATAVAIAVAATAAAIAVVTAAAIAVATVAIAAATAAIAAATAAIVVTLAEAQVAVGVQGKIGRYQIRLLKVDFVD